MNCKKGGCDVMERDAAGPCLARMLSARVGHWRHCLLFLHAMALVTRILNV